MEGSAAALEPIFPTEPSDDSKFRTIPNDYSHYSRLSTAKRDIRLLQILPNWGNGQFHVVVSRHRLDNVTDYRALSYTWGDLNDTTEIKVIFFDEDEFARHSRTRETCDTPEDTATAEATDAVDAVDATAVGYRDFRTRFLSLPSWRTVAVRRHHDFRITRSLYRALRALEHAPHVSYYWIDMLCINQGDPIERAEQVTIMKDIFSSASKVLIWLDCDERSTAAWLAEENSEMVIFFAILRDNGLFEQDRGDSSKVKKYSDLWTEFVETASTIMESPGECGLLDSLRAQRHPDSSLPQRFFPTLLDNFLAVERLSLSDSPVCWSATSSKRCAPGSQMDATNLCRAFIIWLCNIYDSPSDARVARALYLFRKRVMNPRSDVLAFVRHYRMMVNFKAEFPLPGLLVRLEHMIRPWFGRIWVLQEVMCSRHAEFLLNSGSCSLTTFFVLYTLYLEGTTFSFKEKPSDTILLDVTLASVWLTLCHRVQNGGLTTIDMPLKDVLDSLRRMESTDARDQVIAIYQLVTDFSLHEFRPDYEKGVAETFIHFTHCVIKAGAFEQILFALGNGLRGASGLSLPTWVPDFRSEKAQKRDMGIESLNTFQGRPPNAAMLVMRGHLVSGILAVVDPLGEEESLGKFFSRMWNQLETFFSEISCPNTIRGRASYLEDRSASTMPSVASLAKLMLRLESECLLHDLVTLGCLWTIDDNAELGAHVENRVQFELLRHLVNHASEWTQCVRRDEVPSIWAWRFSQICVIFTTDGIATIGPPASRAGDVVVKFDHCTTPVVLRETRQKAESACRMNDHPMYELVGGCMFDGHTEYQVTNRPEFSDVLNAESWDPLRKENGLSHYARGDFLPRLWHLV